MVNGALLFLQRIPDVVHCIYYLIAACFYFAWAPLAFFTQYQLQSLLPLRLSLSPLRPVPSILSEAAHPSGPPRPAPAPSVAAMRLTFDQFIEVPAMHQFFNGMFDWGNSDNDNATVDPRDSDLRWEWEGLNENFIRNE